MKKLMSFFVIFFILAATVFSQTNQQTEAKKFYRLGLAPLIRDGIFDPEDVRNLFSKKPKITKENEAVYVLLGDGQFINGELVDAFFEQIGTTEIGSIFIRPGEKIEKMAFFSASGRVKTTGRLEWAGQKPFEAFCFSIVFNRRIFWFLIPKRCGNISLWKIGNEELVKEAIEESEEGIPEAVFTPPSKFGEEPKLKTWPRKIKKSEKYEYLVDVYAAEFQGCGNEYLGSRIGTTRPIEEDFKIFITGGAAFPIYTKDGGWKTVFMADLGAMYQLENLSIGAGLGFSTRIREDKDDQFEGLANISLQISEKMNLFFEYRFPVKEDKEDPEFIKAHRKFIGGVRITF